MRGTRHIIEPGAMLGVLGGGQLGAMFGRAARRLGYRQAVWDPDPDAPALREADLPIAAPFGVAQPRFDEFVSSISAATYEWENIPVSLVETLEQRLQVRPAASLLRTVQDRLRQKTFLAGRGFPVVPFKPVSLAEPVSVPTEIGFPCLCKTTTLGYDGKGQWRLSGPDDVAPVQADLRRQPGGPDPAQPRWILERWLGFDKELSVVVARGADGQRCAYPVVENVHEGGILRTTCVPASVDPGTAERASALAVSVVEAMGGVGVFCIELFLMRDGALFINEVAPRPHNSGHYTLDACTVSQFEQQVRALCGLPLGEVRLLSAAVMVNLIGEEILKTASAAPLAALLGTPGALLHLYGKKTLRPGRKMGHVTFVSEKVEEAWQQAIRFQRALHDAPGPSYEPGGASPAP
jgi:5-(carboxyamino)imidazole ribonucleotide synthase